MKEDTRTNEQPVEKGMSSMMESSSTIHPTFLATVREETVRIMMDTGATRSYVCTDLITKLGIKPVRREQRCIEKMYGTRKKTVEVYNITIKSSVIEGFQLKVDYINAEKDITFRIQKSLESRTNIQGSEVYAFIKTEKHKIYFPLTACLVLPTTNEFEQMSHRY